MEGDKKRMLVHHTIEVKLSLIDRFFVLFGWYPILYVTIETDKEDISVINRDVKTILSIPPYLEKKTRKRFNRRRGGKAQFYG